MIPLKLQPGFTLIEVLVALTIVAIGLLGLANLQTIGLQNNHSADLMSRAMWFTNDIIDKARSNISQNQSFYQDIYSDTTTYDCNSDVTQNQNDPKVKQDRQEWVDTVCRELPNARITLCTSSNPSANQPCNVGGQIQGITPYMVKLEWDDPTQRGGGRQTLITTFQVTRVPDNIKDYLNQYISTSN